MDLDGREPTTDPLEDDVQAVALRYLTPRAHFTLRRAFKAVIHCHAEPPVPLA